MPCAILVSIATALNKRLEKAHDENIGKVGGDGTTVQMIFFDGEEAFKDWTR
jgi:glutaminyl-peptide cyclotransferase